MPGVLDSVLEMEKEGKTDAEIAAALQEQGHSVQEVNDAINQSKIKKAVVSPEGMQPSIMQSHEEEQPSMPVPVPSKKKKMMMQQQQIPQEQVFSPAIIPQPEYQYQNSNQMQTPYDYSNYQNQPVSSGAGTSDVETIEEISEEIVNEKMAEVKNSIEDLSEFKQNIQARVNDIDDRLKRIEMNIDRLQAALIGKVQEYNQNINALGTEMRAVEEGFSKVLNPLVDNIKELGKITERMKAKDKQK